MDFWPFLFSEDTEFIHALVSVIGSSSVAHGLGNQNCLFILGLLNNCSKSKIFMMSKKEASIKVQ